MTPQQLADLHAAAFKAERPWTADEFTALLASRYVTLQHGPHGFALIRTVAEETELLTLAVHPNHQREGLAGALISGWLDHAQAAHAFLEVAADNTAAQHLYLKHGFAETGRRMAYYARADGPAADAVLMTRALPYRQYAESPSIH